MFVDADTDGVYIKHCQVNATPNPEQRDTWMLRDNGVLHKEIIFRK